MSNDQPGWTPPQPSSENPTDGPAEPQQPQTPSPQEPPAYPQQPYGQPAQPQPPYGQPPYGQPAYGQPGYGQSAYGVVGRDPDARPGTVTAAAIVTWILTGLTGLLFLGLTIAMLAAKSDVLDAMRDEVSKSDSSITVADLESIYGVIVAVFLVIVVWCVIAFVLAVFAFRRSNVARIILVVSSCVTALFSLIGIGSGVSVVTLVGSVAVVILLFVGGAGDWYSRRGGAPYAGSPTHQPW
jgi:hypothetical protein